MALNADALKVVRDLNKKFGDGTIVLASDAPPTITRITTGSLAVDVALGGGLPTGQWSEFIGEHSHGKTYLAMSTVAANQRKDPDHVTVWVAAEEWVTEYAVMIGVDMSRVLLVESNIMEDVYESVLRFAESKGVDLIVIDSYPALIPKSEDEKQMEDATVGLGAKMTNKFFRKVGKAMKRSLTEEERPVTGILINQWRSKIGVMYGDPRTTSGGQGKDYACFVRLEVKRDGWIEKKIEGVKEKAKIGQGIKVVTLKNKTYPPRQVAFFDMYFAEGGDVEPGRIDTGKEIVALGILSGVIERKGSTYHYSGQKWVGGEATLAGIREDLDLSERLSADVLEVITRGKVALATDEGDDDDEE